MVEKITQFPIQNERSTWQVEDIKERKGAAGEESEKSNHQNVAECPWTFRHERTAERAAVGEYAIWHTKQSSEEENKKVLPSLWRTFRLRFDDIYAAEANEAIVCTRTSSEGIEDTTPAGYVLL